MALTNNEIAAKYAELVDKIVKGMIKDFRANGLDEGLIAKNIVGGLTIAGVQVGVDFGAPSWLIAQTVAAATEKVLADRSPAPKAN